MVWLFYLESLYDSEYGCGGRAAHLGMVDYPMLVSELLGTPSLLSRLKSMHMGSSCYLMR